MRSRRLPDGSPDFRTLDDPEPARPAPVPTPPERPPAIEPPGFWDRVRYLLHWFIE